MLHRKNMPREGYKNSTLKDGYEYLYGTKEGIKHDNFDIDNEGFIEYCNDFINSINIHY